ncbi:MAG: hypothetical protein F6J90_24565 [Moorea sp. SIOASIH]|nr:hypothetical protein [Moorena sp. SIOASIH]NEO39335.1 hypothetical protein [Moorena sp. SIOASIH]
MFRSISYNNRKHSAVSRQPSAVSGQLILFKSCSLTLAYGQWLFGVACA